MRAGAGRLGRAVLGQRRSGTQVTRMARKARAGGLVAVRRLIRVVLILLGLLRVVGASGILLRRRIARRAVRLLRNRGLAWMWSGLLLL